MKKKRIFSICSLPAETAKVKARTRNRLYRFQPEGFRWSGVKVEKYKQEGADWKDIVRQNIIGVRGENTKFHFRYFEIMPGGNSSYEVHSHEHVVVCVRGKGKVRLGSRLIDMNHLDVLYIKAETPHQLFNPYDEPFGFFCIVDSERDRPRPAKRKKK